MPSPKRNDTEIARDRELVAQMYLSGKGQQQIADELNERPDCKYTLSRQQITYDIGVLRKEWLASGVRDFDAAKAEELVKIDNLEREYWDAWRNSLGENITLTEKNALSGLTETTKQTKELNGDPRYLEGVRWCIERRCKILGLDAPEKKEVTIYDKDPAEMTIDELEAEIATLENHSAVH